MWLKKFSFDHQNVEIIMKFDVFPDPTWVRTDKHKSVICLQWDEVVEADFVVNPLQLPPDTEALDRPNLRRPVHQEIHRLVDELAHLQKDMHRPSDASPPRRRSLLHGVRSLFLRKNLNLRKLPYLFRENNK